MIGSIAKLSSGDKEGETTMKIEVKRFVKFIAIQAVIMAAALAVIGFSTGHKVWVVACTIPPMPNECRTFGPSVFSSSRTARWWTC